MSLVPPDLLVHVESATGADPALDAEIARAFGVEPREYTASVDAALDLMHRMLPHWHWHIGRGASGATVYATLSHGHKTVTAEGTTVPLVVLAAVMKGMG